MPRRILSLLTPVLLTAGLVVTAPPVSATEPTEVSANPAAVDVPAAEGAELPALVRVWVTAGARIPVAGARVRLVGPDGSTLARTVSAVNGQAVLMPDAAPPRGSYLVSIGGEADGVPTEVLRMRGRVRPVDTQVADINPLTTFEVACDQTKRSRRSCDRLLNKALDLPRGPDHSRLAALAEWHFTPRGAIEAAEEGSSTLWGVARSAMKGGRDAVADIRRSTPAPRLAMKPAGVAASLVEAVAGTVASKVAGPYVDKLLLAMGLTQPTPDVATAEQVAQLQQQIDVVEQQLGTLEAQQQAAASLLDSITGAIDVANYQVLRSGFLKQSGDLVTLAQDLHYLSAYTDCSKSSANPDRCGTPLAEDGPTSGVGPADCAATQSAVNEWQKAALIQCAYLINGLAAYTSTYAQSVAQTALIGGGAASAGLVQLGQVAYASHVGDGLVTTTNQDAIRSVGEYWLSQWSVDISAWLIASNQPAVLPNFEQPATVLQQATADARVAATAESDTTGRYFGKAIPADCSLAVYNMRTRTLQALGRYASAPAAQSNVVVVPPGSEVTDQTRGCIEFSFSDIMSSSRLSGDAISNSAALSEHWAPYASSAATNVDTCGNVDNNTWLRGLPLLVCDSFAFTAGAAPRPVRACIMLEGATGSLPIWAPGTQYNYRVSPKPVRTVTVNSCEVLAATSVDAPFTYPYLFMVGNTEHHWMAVAGPIMLSYPPEVFTKYPSSWPAHYGGGTILSLIPFGAPAEQRATTYTRHWMMERSLQAGEAYLPTT